MSLVLKKKILSFLWFSVNRWIVNESKKAENCSSKKRPKIFLFEISPTFRQMFKIKTLNGKPYLGTGPEKTSKFSFETIISSLSGWFEFWTFEPVTFTSIEKTGIFCEKISLSILDQITFLCSKKTTLFYYLWIFYLF